MDENKVLEEIANNIRIIRLKKRISQEALAEKAFISTKYLNMIENKKANPTIIIIIRICQVLEVDLNSIWQNFQNSSAKEER